MNNERIVSKSEIINIENLQTDFLSLKVGEEIPRLQISQIRKITNKAKQDNLPGVAYKYLIDTVEGKVLMVTSWVLWKKIAAVLQKAGRIDVDLEIKHLGIEEYSIIVL